MTGGVSNRDAFEVGSWVVLAIMGAVAAYHKWKKAEHAKKEEEERLRRSNVKIPPFTELASKLTCLCTEIRTETRAERVQIHLFHNGEHYKVNNTSMQRFSCAIESLGLGVAPAAGTYARCLISCYIEGLSPIVKTDGAYGIHIDELPDSSYKTAMMLTDAGMHKGARLIWEGEVVGFVLLTFRDKKRAADRCLFDMLVDQALVPNTDTKEMVPRFCEGKCEDCRLTTYYVPQIELLLASGGVDMAKAMVADVKS